MGSNSRCSKLAGDNYLVRLVGKACVGDDEAVENTVAAYAVGKVYRKGAPRAFNSAGAGRAVTFDREGEAREIDLPGIGVAGGD